MPHLISHKEDFFEIAVNWSILENHVWNNLSYLVKCSILQPRRR